MRILLAEDEIGMQDFLRNVLIDLGYNVDMVSSGRAVYLLGSIDYKLIIVDVNLPEWDGLAGVNLAKTFGNKSPILFITADSGFKIESHDVLYKPFSQQDFIDVLLKLTKEKKG